MIQHYRALADDPRMAAFARAIAATVEPGDVVADIGCGLGTYAVLACRAGAARVLAVEAGPIVEVAREVLRDNGCADRVRLLSGLSTEIEPPERARVVIFEDYRLALTTPKVMRVVEDLRTRWLAPGGVLVPARARQTLALVEDAAGRAEIDRFASAGETVCGVSLRPTRKRAFAEPTPRRLTPAQLLGEPMLLRELELATASVAFQQSGEIVASRDGEAHGLLVWNDFLLGNEWHSNAPGAPESAWRPLLYPLDPPLAVRAGARVRWSFEAAPFGDELVFRWSAERDGERVSACSLDSLPLQLPR